MKRMNIPLRTARILIFFSVGLFLILARVWYLSVVQYDKHYLESRKPQRRTRILRGERGTIRDRFNIPLATNKIQYNALLLYNEIREIPSIHWEKTKKGKQKIWARRNYIQQLSAFLGEMLDLDPGDVEDIIHGKACLFPHTPFVIKEDISEELYSRLSTAQKDWPGLYVEETTQRVYPQGKTGCDVVGFLGAISSFEYAKIAREMRDLKQFLDEQSCGKPVLLPPGFSSPKQVEQRYVALRNQSYTIHAQVGKSGLEKSFEEDLRGRTKKQIVEVDVQGNTLRTLSGQTPPDSGKRIISSLSIELQKTAEQLLSEYEGLQDQRDAAGTKKRKTPWQRGGAIVAMHPKTGEVLALASYPRFDPNSFVPTFTTEKKAEKHGEIIQWLEQDAYIGEIWDSKRSMERERFRDGVYTLEKKELTWDSYLDTILHEKSRLHNYFQKIHTLSDALNFPQEEIDKLTHQRDRFLFYDLLDLVVDRNWLSSPLLEKIEETPLSELRRLSCLIAKESSTLKEELLLEFHKGPFANWRKEFFPAFLKEKRKSERARGTYARPYLDHLTQEEKRQFSKFWEENKVDRLGKRLIQDSSLKEFLGPLSQEERFAFLKAVRTYEDLESPLRGRYPHLKNERGVQKLKHLAAAFYPSSGFGYGRSQAFRQASPMGSIFKVVPSYTGLYQSYEKQRSSLNPLTLTDDMQWTSKPGSNAQVLGYFSDGTPIQRWYKGGRLPRAYPKIGTIDVTKALERSSNIYFSILASDVLNSPNDLLRAATAFGLGAKTEIALPGEYSGILPDDILHNRTGLYSFAIGQHSLVVTPLQTASMLCAIANGGELPVPQIVNFSCGRDRDAAPFSAKNYPHKQALELLGISFPLFLQSDAYDREGQIVCHEPVIKHKIPMPGPVKKMLLEGMHKVTNGERGSARPAIMRKPFHNKQALRAYRKLAPQMVGKTGTAEILYKQTIDAETPAELEKHVWFGAIGYEDETLKAPELVVVVYSRFGSAGRQGAPIAARLIEKWREIQASH